MADSSAMDVDVPVAGPSNAGGLQTNADASGSHTNGDANGVVIATERVHLSSNRTTFPIPNNPNVTLFYDDDSESDVGAGRIVRTGYVFDPLMMLHCQDDYTPTDDIHDSGEGHPEEPMRIKRIFNRLKEQGLIRRMKRLEFEEVQEHQVKLVHGDMHWIKVISTESELGISPHSRLMLTV